MGRTVHVSFPDTVASKYGNWGRGETAELDLDKKWVRRWIKDKAVTVLSPLPEDVQAELSSGEESEDIVVEKTESNEGRTPAEMTVPSVNTPVPSVNTPVPSKRTRG